MTDDQIIREALLSAWRMAAVGTPQYRRDAALAALDRMAAQVAELEGRMVAIADIGGNLPDDRLTTRTGPNDAVSRGLMFCEARRIALGTFPRCPKCAGILWPTDSVLDGMHESCAKEEITWTNEHQTT